MVHRGQASVLAWRADAGGSWALAAHSKAFNPVTGLDVSADGRFVGLATAEGEAFLLDAATLAVKRAVKKAHMVFATSVAFAGDSHAFVSTSADASARVVAVPAATSGAGVLRLLLVLLMLAVTAAALVLLLPVRAATS